MKTKKPQESDLTPAQKEAWRKVWLYTYFKDLPTQSRKKMIDLVYRRHIVGEKKAAFFSEEESKSYKAYIKRRAELYQAEHDRRFKDAMISMAAAFDAKQISELRKDILADTGKAAKQTQPTKQPINPAPNTFEEYSQDQWRCRLKDSDYIHLGKTRIGFKYISTLLDNPNKRYDPLALEGCSPEVFKGSGAIHSKNNIGEYSAEQKILMEQDLWMKEKMTLPATTKETVGKLLEEIKQIELDIDDLKQDPEINKKEISEKQKDIQSIKKYLSQTTQNGKTREADPGKEKERVRITKAINEAIQYIITLSPDMGKHLDNTIKTGNLFSYIGDRLFNPPDPD